MDQTRTQARSAAKDQAPLPTWCRLSFQVSLVPPASGKVFSLDRGPRTVKVLVCAPRPVVIAGTLILIANHPLGWKLINFVRHLMSW